MTIPTRPLRELLAEAFQREGRISDAPEHTADIAMRVLAEYNPCFAKAADNVIDGQPEPVFVLRAQDRLAFDSVAHYWIIAAITERVPSAKIDSAWAIAAAMNAWPNQRMPD